MTLDTRRTASENARHTSCGCAPCNTAPTNSMSPTPPLSTLRPECSLVARRSSLDGGRGRLLGQVAFAWGFRGPSGSFRASSCWLAIVAGQGACFAVWGVLPNLLFGGVFGELVEVVEPGLGGVHFGEDPASVGRGRRPRRITPDDSTTPWRATSYRPSSRPKKGGRRVKMACHTGQQRLLAVSNGHSKWRRCWENASDQHIRLRSQGGSIPQLHFLCHLPETLGQTDSGSDADDRSLESGTGRLALLVHAICYGSATTGMSVSGATSWARRISSTSRCPTSRPGTRRPWPNSSTQRCRAMRPELPPRAHSPRPRVPGAGFEPA